MTSADYSMLPVGLMVLIVDDDQATGDLWTRILSEAPGVCAVQAVDGIEALRLARQLGPDVILMDLAMPRMDGLAATRKLKNDPETARVPVIAVTGAAYDPQAVLDAGCDGYLVKPVSAETLVQTISNALGRSS